MDKENEKLDPQVYFDILKNSKHQTTDKFLDDFQKVIQQELSKAMFTKQNKMVKKLAYAMSIIPRERELIKNGVDVYVLKDDVEDYIKHVADKAVKVIELDNYERSIPNEVVEKLQKIQETTPFDRYFVVFTDYTGEQTRKVQEERRRKDPILFGCFEQQIDGVWDVFDRFYFIADWEDEYCDLTLTKMVDAMSKKGKDIIHELAIPDATEETIRSYLNALEEKRGRFTLKPKKKSFFNKVRTAFKELIK